MYIQRDVFVPTPLRTTQLKDLSSFVIIDIRSQQSFLSAHLRDSISLQTPTQILEFLHTDGNKPIALICFSSKRAKEMAIKLAKELDKSFYPHMNIYYFDKGIMELDASCFPLVIPSYDTRDSRDSLDSMGSIDSLDSMDSMTPVSVSLAPPPPY
ncbi:hypothetical protein BKH46_08995 [Helicobacter sp. 12S02634-8]|uniref:rhodanese-like domain-containing protein n=1 Tax=Helicobacter sp. 12S02634-8 TaxID=1476199 RepID=UPI000BCAF8A5|nr:rhodanese-like domain-containing protein [Helicobacter sp. 12S02634-8]PAF46113.1 hypothetical protein BKH46_08995 [Helicobacter sp. 12S02634-8]